MGALTGKVAIVTGASQGIGQGIAIAFGEAGADVVCAARNLEKLRETCALVERRARERLRRPAMCGRWATSRPAWRRPSRLSAGSISW